MKTGETTKATTEKRWSTNRSFLPRRRPAPCRRPSGAPFGRGGWTGTSSRGHASGSTPATAAASQYCSSSCKSNEARAVQPERMSDVHTSGVHLQIILRPESHKKAGCTANHERREPVFILAVDPALWPRVRRHARRAEWRHRQHNLGGRTRVSCST